MFQVERKGGPLASFILPTTLTLASLLTYVHTYLGLQSSNTHNLVLKRMRYRER